MRWCMIYDRHAIVFLYLISDRIDDFLIDSHLKIVAHKLIRDPYERIKPMDAYDDKAKCSRKIIFVLDMDFFMADEILSLGPVDKRRKHDDRLKYPRDKRRSYLVWYKYTVFALCFAYQSASPYILQRKNDQ